MTRYRDDFDCPVAFEEHQVADTLAEVLAEHGIRQLHLAETEKYAHVTYFFNGGREDEWEGETRILVPSPKDVATYDQKPEMSAAEVTRRFEEEIGDGYRFAIVNFANPDMVGHTGVIPAVIRAVETVDACLGRVVAAVERARRCLPRHRRPRQRRADARAGRHEPAHRAHDQPRAAFRSRSTARSWRTAGRSPISCQPASICSEFPQARE